MVDDTDNTALAEPELAIHTHHTTHKSTDKRGCIGKVFSRTTLLEIKELFALAWPTVLSYFFYHMIMMISMFFAGRLGEVELAAGTLALSFINVTGPSLFIGLASALETLCSQAFGANNFRLVGVVLQRGILILALTSLLSCALWTNTELLLLSLHQTQNVARLTQEFVLICLPSLVGNFMFTLLQRYLQAQGIVRPIFYVGAASSVLQIGFNALFVYVFDLGFRGVAISWALSTTTMFLLMLLYMKVFKLHKNTWPGWTTESLLDWCQFLKLAVSGMLMIVIEWWSFEIGSFIAGSLGEVQLGVFGIMFQWLAFVFMLALGMSVAAGVRVGRALGAGNPNAAVKTIQVAIGLTVCSELVIVIIFLSLGDLSGRVFSGNSDVLAVYKKNLPLMSCHLFFDGLQGACSGIVRGCGRQKIGMLINFISYICVGLPLGITLTFFVFHEIFGLWIGVFCAGILQSFLYITLLWRTNWEQQAKLAQERTSTKAVLELNSDGLTNGDCHTREEPGYGKVTDPVIASWIYKSSSLLFLNRVKNDESQARHSLLSGSVDEHGGERHHPEDNGEREHAAKAAHMKPSSRLTPSKKRSLVIQRLIPLAICLAILGAAVAIRFLIPLPSSSEVEKAANVTTSSNTTANFTSGF